MKPAHALIALLAGLVVVHPATAMPPQPTATSSRQEAQAAIAKARQMVKEKAPFAEVIPAFEQAIKRWQELGDRKEELLAVGNLISAYTAKGDLNKAMQLSRKYLDLLQHSTPPISHQYKPLFLSLASNIAGLQGDEHQVIQ